MKVVHTITGSSGASSRQLSSSRDFHPVFQLCTAIWGQIAMIADIGGAARQMKHGEQSCKEPWHAVQQ